MKKIILFLLTATMLLSIFGCTEAKSDENGTENTTQAENTTQTAVPLSGRYYAEHNTDEPNAESKVPYLDLDISNSKFTMGNSIAASYAEEGNLTIDGNKLTLSGELATFVFEIQNEKNILLTDNGNHPYIKVINYVVFTYEENMSE